MRHDDNYRDILLDLIHEMRVAAELNPGSAHSRFIIKAVTHAERQMRKVDNA